MHKALHVRLTFYCSQMLNFKDFLKLEVKYNFFFPFIRGGGGGGEREKGK